MDGIVIIIIIIIAIIIRIVRIDHKQINIISC